MNLFEIRELRKWFFDCFPNPPCRDLFVSTTGNGPIDEVDLDGLFGDYGIKPNYLNEKTEVLVIGQTGWDRADLTELLDLRANKTLKVYSQEMFLCHWITNRDPFDFPEILMRFGAEHPALMFFSSIGFDWPTTFVTKGDGEIKLELPEVGLLRHFGYQTGSYGISEADRRRILQRVFEDVLPLVNSDAYMQEWGTPRSTSRLRKLANSLASFCRNEKRKKHGSIAAISDWENDLRWLHDRYYKGHFTFQWPDTQVF